MKKITPAVLIIAIITLLSSCHSGCGCPGGAGYKQSKSQNNYKPKVTNLSLFSA